jgi:hypothetical protein
VRSNALIVHQVSLNRLNGYSDLAKFRQFVARGRQPSRGTSIASLGLFASVSVTFGWDDRLPAVKKTLASTGAKERKPMKSNHSTASPAELKSTGRRTGMPRLCDYFPPSG